MPSGLEQAKDPQLRASAKARGSELKQAGVNVNLAPVADTVPAEIGRANEPIGKWGREYGSTPAAAGKGALAFARGMQDAGVEPTVKHFPGIGRITGNTDLTATGISDTVATTTDPHLAPFAKNIEGGTRIVMVGSAHYPKIDGEKPALFSRKIVTGMLRDEMGFDGVAITDDVGAAKAVSATPVGERATKFIAAGGDIVLTADPGRGEHHGHRHPDHGEGRSRLRPAGDRLGHPGAHPQGGHGPAALRLSPTPRSRRRGSSRRASARGRGRRAPGARSARRSRAASCPPAARGRWPVGP
uniref:Uncharacterized protein n=1 Tax=Janibacter limosus TaxID=53458 RepID=A0AC61U277_9MICO|nr:glycoside hydrolase family 3 N-terminal domain-containing protein [Janibacter limosus]